MALKVSKCLTGTAGINSVDRAKLKEMAAEYRTGDVTQDYVLAVNDILTELREARAAVVAAVQKSMPKASEATPEDTAAKAALEAEAEARDAAEADRRAQFAKKGEVAQEVLDTIDIVETMTSRELIKTRGREKYVAALTWLLRALHNTDANFLRTGAVPFIERFMEGVSKNALYREAILAAAKEEGVVTAMIVNTKTKVSRPNPFFTAIIQAGMFQEARRVASFRNLPPEYATPSTVPSPEKMARVAPRTAPGMFSFDEQETPDVETPVDTTEAFKAARALSEEIHNINNRADKPNSKVRKDLTAKLKDLWKAVQDEGTEDFQFQGKPLEDYFDNGEPKTKLVDGYFSVVSEEGSEEVRRQVEADLRRAGAEPLSGDDYVARNTFGDWEVAGFGETGLLSEDTVGTGEQDDTVKARKRAAAAIAKMRGRFFRDDGTPITSAVPHGRIRMLVNAFRAKLSIKPTIHIYKNQAALKLANPELYKRAAAERKQGDFDTTSAVGYSFVSDGKTEVIIFSDRVATEKQLNFVLAHETLGHFGFRAIMPGDEFTAVMDMVYDSSSHVQAVVDAAMAAHGMSKAEAVEEYLADFAGTMETNLLKRVWYRLKNWLNKLGVKFEDDMARFVMSQARAYVRNGNLGGTTIDFAKIAERWLALETIQDPFGTGRYAQSHESYSDKNRMAADRYAGRIPDPERNEGSNWNNLSENAKEWFQDRGINTQELGRRIVNELKTMNYAARENRGYRKLYDILRDTVHRATFLRSKYNNMMAKTLQPAFELPEWMGGANLSRATSGRATKEDLRLASEMLRITSLVKMRQFTEKELNAFGSLFEFVDGVPQRTDVASKLAALGRFTLKDMQEGFDYIDRSPQPMTKEELARLAAERDKLLNEKKDNPKEAKRIRDEYESLMSAKSYYVETKRRFEGIKGLTKDSPAWLAYNEVRNTMDEAALDLLEANFAAAKGERDNVLRAVKHFLGREPTEADTQFIQSVTDKYLTIRGEGASINDRGEITLNSDNVRKAGNFIAAFNAAVLGERNDRTAELIKNYYSTREADDVAAGINGLKAKAKIATSGRRRFIMQQAIQNLSMFELGKSDAELHAKQSIAHGYVPFGREGTWQVRVNAVNPKTGRVYKVKDGYREKLLYMQTNSKAEAIRSAKYVNDIFADGNEGALFEMEVLNEDGEYEIKKVRLEAVPSAAMQTPSVVADVNLNDVISAITQFSIELHPEEREKLIVGLTSQNARARTRLRRTGAPGEDPNFLKYVSQHLEAVASTVARKHNRHHIVRLFDDADGESERLWFGSPEEYEKLKELWLKAKDDPTVSEVRKQAYKRDFEDYHYTFKVRDSQHYGNSYKTRGHRLMAFLDAQKDVEFTDFGSGELTSKVRMWTTFAMMGASPATAILNYLSLPMNVLPSMAGRNSKNGFGGGFGLAASSAELTHALAQTKNYEQSEVKYWKDLLDDKTNAKLKAAGFTRLEAEFMLQEVGSGAMQAALTNALLGTARGKITSGAGQQMAKAWMSLFNYSEQSARRSTGLATFRLEFKRSLLEAQDRGMDEVEANAYAYERASKAAVEMIENTLGEYAMFNRPALFRGGIGQFIFMFKMYPVNMVLMLSSLRRQEQLLALGLILLLSGIKGLPFAEDMMDILDTVAQALGFGPRGLWKGSAEKSLADAIDQIAPGMTPLALRGVVNHWMPANIADRTSLGNIVPGTGIALKGADVGRELIEIGGPFASFTQGMLATSADLGRWVQDPSVQGLADVARTSPVTMARAFGDTWTFYETGAIVNRKGYVVSPDMHMGVALTRMLGFYPSTAVAENDVVRMGTRLGNYRKDIAAHFYSKYVVAKMSKDQDAVNDVLERVNSWNEGAKGTELELVNFRKGAERAYRSATMTTTQRYLRTVPKNIRSEAERTMEMLLTDNEKTAAAASN